VPGERARAGAGNIDKNSIKLVFEGKRLRCIEHNRLHVPNAGKFESRLHGADAVLVKVRGDYTALGTSRSRQEQSFASRRGTQIENAIAVPDPKQQRHCLGSLVLDRNPTLAHSFACGGTTALKNPGVTEQPPWQNVAPYSLKRLIYIVAVFVVEQIAGKSGGMVVRLEQAACPFLSKNSKPAFHHPGGV
jgi:hypothetical protein